MGDFPAQRLSYAKLPVFSNDKVDSSWKSRIIESCRGYAVAEQERMLKKSDQYGLSSLCLGRFPPVQHGRKMGVVEETVVEAEVMGEVTTAEVTTAEVIMAAAGTITTAGIIITGA